MDNAAINQIDMDAYRKVRDEGNPWMRREEHGVIAVSGAEAIQFLNGLISNDVAALPDRESMLASFPNAKGRLIAIVRVENEGGRFVFTTEEQTYRTVLDNLNRFTLAGDFVVEDLTEDSAVLEVIGANAEPLVTELIGGEGARQFGNEQVFVRETVRSGGVAVRGERKMIDEIGAELEKSGAVGADGPLAEVLRIETGIPRFGTDMNEDTVVPETGIEGLISYEKGCYIGQEVIARIHFRGKVAKQLAGVVLDDEFVPQSGAELLSEDGKNAGSVTSADYSPGMGKGIALAYVRNAFLEPGTRLLVEGQPCSVTELPFIQ